MNEELLSLQFSVGTFNILAPCYNNLSGGIIESSKEILYLPRINQIIDTLEEIDADMMCLQEFWFREEIIKLFETRLEKRLYFKISC